MSEFHSFAPHLRRWVATLKPERVLEWGPGESTRIIREAAPEALIVSIEHQRRYAEIARTTGHSHVVCIDAQTRASRYGAHAAMLGEPFQLIFVDGRRRVECALWACAMLAHDGVILMHDWERPEYSILRPLIDIVEDHGDTVVFQPKPCIDWSGYHGR
jgi:predicted O-methyltransferase YrrM